jgi:hypothetical protein
MTEDRQRMTDNGRAVLCPLFSVLCLPFLIADAAVVPAGGRGDVFAAEPYIAGQDA